jgi:aryl-alcohol dehydrogenase-like predicted oxidoreductase
MKARKLGASDLNLSVVGLGTWAIGGGGWEFSWGAQDDRESVAAISRAMELGVSWIDTAPVYGLGHSEEVVGTAIKGLHRKPVIATKCGRVWDKNRKISHCLKEKSIRAEVEASLKRLGVSAIDLYQIHWPVPDEDIEEAWGTIADLVKEGKIRYAGVCNFQVEHLERIQSIHPVTSLQPPYNMITRGVEDELLGYCAEKGIGVITYSPMGKGLLTEKFARSWVQGLPDDDHRRREAHFQEPELSANLELVGGLRRIAEKDHRTVSQLAIAWVLRRPEVTAAIVGARHAHQIEETVAAGDWALPKQSVAAVDKLLSDRQKKLNMSTKQTG